MIQVTKDTKDEVISAMDPSDLSWAKGAAISALFIVLSIVALIVLLIAAPAYWWIPTIVLGLGIIAFIISAVIGVKRVKEKGINMAELGYKTFYGNDTGEKPQDEVPTDTVEIPEVSEHIETMDEQEFASDNDTEESR